MHEYILECRSGKALDTCLKFLFGMGIKPLVDFRLLDNHKVIYQLIFETDEQTIESIRIRCDMLIY